MLEPRGKGIVLWTLRYGDEVRPSADYFSGIDDEPSPPEMLPLIQKLIKKQTRHWKSDLVSDPVQEKLLAIIEAKRKALKPLPKTRSSSKPTTNNVVNIMDALKKSVAAETRRSKH